MIDRKIFDAGKEYKTQLGSVFLESNPGLIDSINKRLPRVWELYKKLRNMDWDENEQSYKDCQVEFKNGDQSEASKMITTLAWQWETDSLAAHHLVPLMAPFVSSTEVWAVFSRIGENEVLHGLTYSEIVRGSFDNPDEVMASVLGRLEPLRRLKAVADVMAHAQQVGAKITLGMIKRDSDEARDAAMLLEFTMFAMERIQFMSSFAVTFALAEAGKFIPIGTIVQKICNDEFNIHVEVHREIVRNELSTVVGRASFQRIKNRLKEVYTELVQSELDFNTKELFADGKELAGLNVERLNKFVLYSATDVFNETGVENPFDIVTKNPLDYMDDWVNLDNSQAAPQEQKTMNYFLGGFSYDIDRIEKETGKRMFDAAALV